MSMPGVEGACKGDSMECGKGGLMRWKVVVVMEGCVVLCYRRAGTNLYIISCNGLLFLPFILGDG